MIISAHLFFSRRSNWDRSLAPKACSFAFTCWSAFERRASSALRSDWAITTSWSRELGSAMIAWSWRTRAQIVSRDNLSHLASSIAALPLFLDCPKKRNIKFCSCTNRGWHTRQGFCLHFDLKLPLFLEKLKLLMTMVKPFTSSYTAATALFSLPSKPFSSTLEVFFHQVVDFMVKGAKMKMVLWKVRIPYVCISFLSHISSDTRSRTEAVSRPSHNPLHLSTQTLDIYVDVDNLTRPAMAECMEDR